MPFSSIRSGNQTSRVLPLAAALLYLFQHSAFAIEWPQEVTAKEGTIVVYQPQPETLEGNVLTGRAATALELKDKSEPIFGTFWFEARIDTDQDNGTALIRDLKVTDVRWPESKDAGEQRFTAIIEGAVPDTGFEISLEKLSSSLATAEVEIESLKNLKNDPPVIIFKEELAVLLLYDGEPRYTKIDKSDYERVMNTPFVVVRDKKGNHYLSSGQLWYGAKEATGPWALIDAPPKDLLQMMPEPADDTPPPATPPEIVAATVPTELISTDGKPNWESLQGGELLYVSNTESPWLRELKTGNMYVLLSGRWFRSKSTDGPWAFVPADELPPSFADIPPASDIGGLRTSVAGTPEADDAVLDAKIPQTAAISKKDTTLEVQYDGKPKFEKIDGTDVAYAVNTATQVLKIDSRYYAVDSGVWFSATSAEGPWQVASEVPEDEIAKIPPSSPVYNTTNVHIYESTPEVVYVGYTPGYMWSFPYYGVPVYGTGWMYRPYMGPIYYPRPPTWGFNVGYNPWTGWNFGMSWSNGFFSFGVSFGGNPRCCGGGWYGGGGYRGPTVINTGDINIGNNVNVGNRVDASNKINNVNRNNLENRNIYNRPENKARNADRSAVKKDMQTARSSRDRKNNVYAERDGNVARRDGEQWQSRENGAWQDNPDLNRELSPEQKNKAQQSRESITPEKRDQVAEAAGERRQESGATQRQRDLDRSSHARDRGAARERSRPTGNRRGGGRRR